MYGYLGFIVCLKKSKISKTINSKITKIAITVIAAATPVLKPLSSSPTNLQLMEYYTCTCDNMCMYLHWMHRSYNIHYWWESFYHNCLALRDTQQVHTVLHNYCLGIHTENSSS